MRLIDADALKPLLREYCVDDDEVVMKWYDIMGVDEVVDRAPTVDAVPVVRCKDCRWWDKTDNGFGYCHAEKHCHISAHWEISIFRTYRGDHFCAEGEREEDE